MKRVTRSDVAAEAGVSETIVSYVLNGNRYVDADKRKRVNDAVKKLGYRPCPMARALKGKLSGHILFIADDLMSEHFAIIINEMEKLVRSKGICISLCSDRNDTSLLDWRFDGLVIASATMSDERITDYIATGIPTVLLGMKDYSGIRGRYGLINSGLEEGSRRAVEYLIEKGRKRIAYIPSLSECSQIDRRDYRYIGYKKAIGEHGLEEIVLPAKPDEKGLMAATGQLYDSTGFDAVFTRTDSVAASVIKALTDKGARIPEDVAVVGVNNSTLSKYLTPALTTLNIRRDEIAKAILSLLEQLGETQKENEKLSVLLNTDLIKRDSI
jgi:Transcriptional regulators